MCNLAGYIGNRRAAPILIEMMKKQEGFMGGYYSGISTISNGRLYHAKVVGSIEQLLHKTEALQFPGNVGIIHSRSESGGGPSCAHPFVSSGGNMAYIANGDFGFYNTEQSKINASDVAIKLEKKGYRFETLSPDLEHYVALNEGNYVHMSEAMCHLISLLLHEGYDHDEAMARAFAKLPAELVGLMIDARLPDRIVAARINMPMMVGQGEQETFVATTAMAFPKEVDIHRIFPVTPASVTEVFVNDIKMSQHDPTIDIVSEITEKLWKDMHVSIEKFLLNSKNDPKSMPQIVNHVKELIPTDQMNQTHHIVYEILRSLKSEGRLIKSHQTVPSAPEGMEAPHIKMYLI